MCLLSDWNMIDNHNVDDTSTSYDSYSAVTLPIGFDLIVAADTLIYIGQLGRLLKYLSSMFRSVTVSGDDGYTVNGKRGLFLFTTEDLDDSPMRLQRESSDYDNKYLSEMNIESDSIVHDNVVNDNRDDEDEDDIPGAVPGWGAQMLSSARFAHSHHYIIMICRMYKFCIVHYRRVKLRKEEGVELPGNAYLVQKI